MVVVHDCGKLHLSALAFLSGLAVKIVCVFDNRLSAHSFDCLLEIILPPRVLVGNLELDRLAPRALSGCWSGCCCDCGFIRRGFSFLAGCWWSVFLLVVGCCSLAWVMGSGSFARAFLANGDGVVFGVGVGCCLLFLSDGVVCATLRGVVGASGALMTAMATKRLVGLHDPSRTIVSPVSPVEVAAG